jgi:hypothetical protein
MVQTVEDGRVGVFVALDHFKSEIVGHYFSTDGSRFAFEPISQAVSTRFGGIAAVPRAVPLRGPITGRLRVSTPPPRSNKILISFHHACDQGDVEVAKQLLEVLDFMAKTARSSRSQISPGHRQPGRCS